MCFSPPRRAIFRASLLYWRLLVKMVCYNLPDQLMSSSKSWCSNSFAGSEATPHESKSAGAHQTYLGLPNEFEDPATLYSKAHYYYRGDGDTLKKISPSGCMRDRPKGSSTASETEMASSGTMLRSSGLSRPWQPTKLLRPPVWALGESCVKVRLSSATQIQPGIDVVMTTAEDSRQDYGTELVDDLKWRSNASLYTYLCMMRIMPRSAHRCPTKQKNRQRLCHSEPVSGQ